MESYFKMVDTINTNVNPVIINIDVSNDCFGGSIDNVSTIFCKFSTTTSPSRLESHGNPSFLVLYEFHHESVNDTVLITFKFILQIEI